MSLTSPLKHETANVSMDPFDDAPTDVRKRPVSMEVDVSSEGELSADVGSEHASSPAHS